MLIMISLYPNNNKKLILGALLMFNLKNDSDAIFEVKHLRPERH